MPAVRFNNNWLGLAGKPFIMVTRAGPLDGGDFGPNTKNTTTNGFYEASLQGKPIHIQGGMTIPLANMPTPNLIPANLIVECEDETVLFTVAAGQVLSLGAGSWLLGGSITDANMTAFEILSWFNNTGSTETTSDIQQSHVFIGMPVSTNALGIRIKHQSSSGNGLNITQLGTGDAIYVGHSPGSGNVAWSINLEGFNGIGPLLNLRYNSAGTMTGPMMQVDDETQTGNAKIPFLLNKDGSLDIQGYSTPYRIRVRNASNSEMCDLGTGSNGNRGVLRLWDATKAAFQYAYIDNGAWVIASSNPT